MATLPLSKKPEILRLHEIQKDHRARFINQFSAIVQSYSPQHVWAWLPIVADLYFSFTLICKCRRRLGQQYTYVAMFNPNHYEQEGVLMNKKYRSIMFILQIVERHFLRKIMEKCIAVLSSLKLVTTKYSVVSNLIQEMGMNGAHTIMEEGYRFILMLFLLDKVKSVSLPDILLKTKYIYTYKNKKQTQISYRIQGYMLLAIFVVKLIRLIVRLVTTKPTIPDDIPIVGNQQNSEDSQQTQLCRICYDSIKNKSSTFCGHTFCWACIIRYLETTPECPICRTKCKPRQVIELQNY